MKKFILFVRRKPLGDETSLTRDTSCEILNIWTRKPSVRKVVKRTDGQAGIVCSIIEQRIQVHGGLIARGPVCVGCRVVR